jgi:hypothetical protein
MLRRFLAAFVVTAFLTLIAAEASVVDIREAGEGCCCCAQAASPFPSIGSRLCCASRCGKTTGDLPAIPGLSTATLPAADLPAALVSVEPRDDESGSRVQSALVALDRSTASHDPPPIYVQKATYLI